MFIYSKEELSNKIDEVMDKYESYNDRIEIFQKISALQAWRIKMSEDILLENLNNSEYCGGCESGADSIQAHTKSCNIKNGFVPHTF